MLNDAAHVRQKEFEDSGFRAFAFKSGYRLFACFGVMFLRHGLNCSFSLSKRRRLMAWPFETSAIRWRLRARLIERPTALATSGGNALPTCLYPDVLLPGNCHSSGKLCIRATMRRVR